MEKNCRECCGKCNKKGCPSVMKGSAYCECQLKQIKADERSMVFSGLRKKIASMKKLLGTVRGFR